MVSPVLVPVWVAGLRAPFRRAGWRQLRFVPITYAVMAVLYFAGNGHAYYLASLYPVLLGLGALPTAEWTLRARRRTPAPGHSDRAQRRRQRGHRAAASPRARSPREHRHGAQPRPGRDGRLARFVHTVSSAWRQIPAAERRHTAIFTANYGEAGAIDLLGPALQLPRAYSGHNGFSEWGEPPAADTHALLVGFNDAGRRRALLRAMPNARHRQRRRRPQQQGAGSPRHALPTHRPVADALAAPHPLRLTPTA